MVRMMMESCLPETFSRIMKGHQNLMRLHPCKMEKAMPKALHGLQSRDYGATALLTKTARTGCAILRHESQMTKKRLVA